MTSIAPTPAESLVVRGTPVQLVDVVKDYGSGARALDAISLDIHPGEHPRRRYHGLVMMLRQSRASLSARSWA